MYVNVKNNTIETIPDVSGEGLKENHGRKG
jgi:hypothetical protein